MMDPNVYLVSTHDQMRAHVEHRERIQAQAEHKDALEEENLRLRQELEDARLLLDAIIRTYGGSALKLAIPHKQRLRANRHDTIRSWEDPATESVVYALAVSP